MEGEEKEIPEDLKHSQHSHRLAAQIHAISGSQKEKKKTTLSQELSLK